MGSRFKVVLKLVLMLLVVWLGIVPVSSLSARPQHLQRSPSESTTAQGADIKRSNPEGMTNPTTYSHVVRVGKTLYLAGQVALDREGTLIGEGDMSAQVGQVLENMKTVLASEGADFSRVVKINIFTTDIDAFRRASTVRSRYFDGHPPASTLVQIERLARPEFLVEIEAIAVAP